MTPEQKKKLLNPNSPDAAGEAYPCHVLPSLSDTMLRKLIQYPDWTNCGTSEIPFADRSSYRSHSKGFILGLARARIPILLPPLSAYSRQSLNIRLPILLRRSGSISRPEKELTKLMRILAWVIATFNRRSPPCWLTGPKL
jgi:hypothetical protein